MRTDAPIYIVAIICVQFIDVFLVPSVGPSGPFIILFPLASRVMRVANRRAWLADFWHGDRKWFTVGDASRGEAERGDTRNGEVVRGGGVLDSLQSNSLSLVEPLCSSLPVIYDLFLSLHFSRRAAGVAWKLGQSLVAASRRLALGIRRKGRFSFQPSTVASVSVAMLVCSDCISRSLMTTSLEPA